MKKILILMLLLSMTLSFTACGSSKDETADTTQETDAAAVDTTTDTVDADYNQLLTLIESITAHDELNAKIVTNRDLYIAGELTLEDLNNGILEISNDSQTMLATLQGATWTSDTYNDKIALLTEAIEALAQGEKLSYDAAVNNDEDTLTESQTYMDTYQEKIDAFFTAMGV